MISNKDKKYIKRNIIQRLDFEGACITRIEESLLSPEQTLLHKQRGFYIPYGLRWKIQRYIPRKTGKKIGKFEEVEVLSEKQIGYLHGLIEDGYLVKKFKKIDVYEKTTDKKIVVQSDELSKAQRKIINRIGKRTTIKKTAYLVVESIDKRKTRRWGNGSAAAAYIVDIKGFRFDKDEILENTKKSVIKYESANILVDHKELLTHIFTTGYDQKLVKVYALNETQEAWEKKTKTQKLSIIVNNRTCPNNGLNTCRSCKECPLSGRCRFTQVQGDNSHAKKVLADIYKELKDELQTTKKLAFLDALGADEEESNGKTETLDDQKESQKEEATPQAVQHSS